MKPDAPSAKLFDTYLNKPGQVILSPNMCTFHITSVNTKNLTAEANILACESWFGFHVHEKVYIEPVSRDVWRMTSKRNEHGQAMFLGEDYGGIGWT